MERILAIGDEARFNPIDESSGYARDSVSETRKLLDKLEEVFDA